MVVALEWAIGSDVLVLKGHDLLGSWLCGHSVEGPFFCASSPWKLRGVKSGFVQRCISAKKYYL